MAIGSLNFALLSGSDVEQFHHQIIPSLHRNAIESQVGFFRETL